jgi:hypothetical protein
MPSMTLWSCGGWRGWLEVAVMARASARADRAPITAADIARLERVVWRSRTGGDADRDAAAHRLWWAYVARDRQHQPC